MKQLCFPLQSGKSIRLQGGFNDSAADLLQLACLTQADLQTDFLDCPEVIWNEEFQIAPSDLVCVYSTRSMSTVYDHVQKSFKLYLNDPKMLEQQSYGIFLWQLSVICSAMAAGFRGKKVQLMHCSMLEKDDQALLLFGESGVGKSTSVQRWRQDGGKAVADDMVLLEYGHEDIFVHRLPTWSACKIQLAGKCYPFNPPLKLKNILAISRDDDREQVRGVSEQEFYAQLYRCGFFHYMPIAEKLSLTDKREFAALIKNCTDILIKRFKPQGFFANLNGDIQETLGVFL